LAAFAAAVAWFVLLDLPHQLRTGALVLLPLLTEGAIAYGMAALISRWSAQRDWSDIHRLALVCGALLVSMLVGFFFVTAGNRFDQIGQGIASIVTIGLLALFARRLQQRDYVAAQARHPVLN
jgi:hypothetical protein